MRMNPHLTFNGQCEEAFRFYESSLGGKITFLMTYGESPLAGKVPAEWRTKVLHASFALGDQLMTGADPSPDRYEKPQGMSVLLTVETVADAECVFAALAQEGTVTMPLAESFWAQRFGMLVDRFGTPWMVNCQRPL